MVYSALPLRELGSFQETPFRRTYVHKFDERGNLKFYDVVNSEESSETYRSSRISYIEDVSTGNLYVDDEWYVVSIKCSLICLNILLFASVVGGFYLIKTPVVISLVLFNALRSSLADQEGKKEEICQKALSDIQFLLKDGIWRIVMAPFCAVAMQCCAFYGIFNPYRGRKWVAAVEHFWQRNVSYKEDGREPVYSSPKGSFALKIEKIQKLRAPYLANCFQIRGNIRQARIHVLGFGSLRQNALNI